ncbi:MAG: TetR/AcrR family transcriptional regulator [Acidimicrobiales bacterium]
MSPRLTRIEQTERNRSLVLAAARRVFPARGYHGATLEHIADEAGFSKGVVYSQFGTKADLFLALLDLRIEERARLNAEVVADLSGERGLAALFEHATLLERSDSEWTRLVIEFRIQAARDPELNRRYAAAHERTIAAAAAIIADLIARSGDQLPFPPRHLAEIIFALRSGAVLEQAANPDALPSSLVSALVKRLFPAPVGARSEV